LPTGATRSIGSANIAGALCEKLIAPARRNVVDPETAPFVRRCGCAIERNRRARPDRRASFERCPERWQPWAPSFGRKTSLRSAKRQLVIASEILSRHSHRCKSATQWAALAINSIIEIGGGAKILPRFLPVVLLIVDHINFDQVILG